MHLRTEASTMNTIQLFFVLYSVVAVSVATQLDDIARDLELIKRKVNAEIIVYYYGML